MTSFDRLKQQFVELYSLTRVQRSLHLALRAVWLGAGGVILGWAANALWGWLPNPVTWFAIGLAFAFGPVIAIWFTLYPVLFSLVPKQEWVWGIDRRMGMREQLSTAWEVVEKQQRGPVSDMLVQEMLAKMPQVREWALQGGWVRKGDALAALAAVVMACFLLTSFLLRPVPEQAADEQSPGVPLTSDARPQEDGQPAPGQQGQAGGQGGEQEGSQDSGQNGEQEGGEQPGEGEGGAGTGETQPGQGSAAENAAIPDPEALADALREMGSELSRQAGTFELGEALENLELDRSADAMDELSEQLGELSTESRENLAEAMRDAAEQLAQSGEQSLSEDLGSAADALGQDDGQAGQAMGEVADDLRQLSEAMGSSEIGSSGAGQGRSSGTGAPEPHDRLTDEGGDFNLPLEDAAQSDLLSPAPPDAEGGEVAGGSLDATSRNGQDAVQNPILPNSFLWKWRDVVSQYFRR